ncbi:MAG: ATP-binding protein [Planctomycetes bacterium]|nr:ATP-binding protein [Planctomycetota bacterium]
MIPLGREESQKLEFKARDALKSPAGIARGVVAMLNAKGGELWVGLGETNGRAVEVQPITNQARELERLWNHFVDTIEPPPAPDEIEVEAIPVESGSILRIEVTPRDERRPYAQLKDGGRHFVVRTGARIRPMTREEIRDASRGTTPKPERSPRDPLRILEREREKLLRSRQPMFWIRIQPDRELGIDIPSRKVERYLRDPTLSGNRETGWTFANAHVELRIEQDRRVLGDDASGRTLIEGSGAIEHRTPLHWLTHSMQESNELYPYALLEKTVSVFRLASAMYSDPELNSKETPSPTRRKMGGRVAKLGLSGLLAINFQLAVDLAITSAKGWKLRAYSPRSHAWQLEHHRVKGFEHLQGELTGDLLLEKPLEFKSKEFLSRPDACALRLIRRVYEAFGLSEDMIPSEFDRTRGILVMPE